MAFFRAVESTRPVEQRLFDDPFAAHFLRPRLQWAVRLSRVPFFLRFVDWYADRRLPGARTSAIARTRFIDDALRSALAAGISQLVILGVGFDCRAYRLPELTSVRVFEVDYPSTLSAKLQSLRTAMPRLPENVSFVSTDFNRNCFAEALHSAGFDASQPVIFLWEGVTNYLSENAVDSVLRCVSGCKAGSKIIFTYVHAGLLDGSVPFYGSARLLRDVARLNEPWTFGLHPCQLGAFLKLRSLELDQDVPAAEYRSRYFGAAAQRMKGYEFYRIAIAQVLADKTLPRERNH